MVPALSPYVSEASRSDRGSRNAETDGLGILELVPVDLFRVWWQDEQEPLSAERAGPPLGRAAHDVRLA